MEFVYEVKASGDFNEVVDKVKESIAKIILAYCGR